MHSCLRLQGPPFRIEFRAVQLDPLLQVDRTGIHGIDPSAYGTIGTAASHGCVGMRIPDVEENLNSGSTEAWMNPFWQFSYFVELHRGWYKAGATPDAPGRYVISEKKRCDADFPLAYASLASLQSRLERLRDRWRASRSGVDHAPGQA